MQALTNSGYIPEELFSQKFDKTLMMDLLRQARHPMTVVSADTAFCYVRVNYVIMSLVWLVLSNSNIPAVIQTLLCLQTMKFSKAQGLTNAKHSLGGNLTFCL
jgi:hypothetical protein